MTIANKLAGALKRKDEEPNFKLAIEVAESRDKGAIDELVQLMDTGKKKQRYDALKVLYEVGNLEPKLLVPKIDFLFDQLSDSDNRVLWGTLYALSTLTLHAAASKKLMANLPRIMDAAERSSVIAKDRAMIILGALAARKPNYADVLPELLGHVERAPINQFATYAERAGEVLRASDRASLIHMIEARQDLDAHPTKRKRMDKLLRRLRG